VAGLPKVDAGGWGTISVGVAVPDEDSTNPIPEPFRPEAWHAMLLRLAGTLPDDLISEARTWLAMDARVDVARAVAFAAATGRVPMLPVEIALMTDALRRAGADTELVDTLDRLEEPVILPVPWAFGAIDPRRAGPGAHPGPIDLTEEYPDGEQLAEERLDHADQVIRAAADAEPGLLAVWRAWRSPADGSPWPAPRRVFVVQAGPDTTGEELIAVTAVLQAALVGVGERSPQVEVCGPGTPVPGYQSSACAHAALIWTEEPPAGVRVARVFDAVDPEQGPVFAHDHALIEDLDELTRLLRYLGNGLPVLTTAATMPDILDQDRPDVVPLTFRTDGHWVWTDTVSYYLERYGLAPEPDLLSYLRLAQDTGPEVSDVALHRVLSVLQRPDHGAPAWSVPPVSA
jgi:hypothetical protein